MSKNKLKFGIAAIVHFFLCVFSANARTYLKDHSASDTTNFCEVKYKLQIVRDLDSSKGSKYEIDIANSKDIDKSVQFLWQKEMSSTFELICRGAKIHNFNIELPGERIIKVILDQRELISVNKKIEYEIHFAERHFPKNRFSLIKMKVNYKKRKIFRRTRYLNKYFFEKYD